MSEQEMKVLHERMKKEDPKLLALMKKCFDAGVSSGKEQAKQEQPWREFASDYERGVIDGRQMQMQSSVDKAVNAMTRRDWVGLTDEERDAMIGVTDLSGTYYYDDLYAVILAAEGKLAEKNSAT